MKVIYKGFGRVGLAAVFSFLEFQSGAEIGVAGGNYSHVLAKSNRKAQLYSIDPWKDNEATYQKAVSKLAPFFGNVEIIRKTSAEAVGMFEDGELDYVYIDAEHDYENVIFDITEWSKKVRSGGIVSGHDYGLSGVIQAVNEYALEHDIKHVFVLTCSSWCWVKP